MELTSIRSRHRVLSLLENMNSPGKYANKGLIIELMAHRMLIWWQKFGKRHPD